MSASTYDFTDNSILNNPVPPVADITDDKICLRRCIVDCSIQNLDAGEGDVAQCIDIPAGTLVLTAWINVITAETANGTCDLGYDGNVDQWGDGVSLATADAVVGHLWAPKYFATANTIDVVATTDGADVDLDGAKFEVVAMMVKGLDNY